MWFDVKTLGKLAILVSIATLITTIFLDVIRTLFWNEWIRALYSKFSLSY